MTAIYHQLPADFINELQAIQKRSTFALDDNEISWGDAFTHQRIEDACRMLLERVESVD